MKNLLYLIAACLTWICLSAPSLPAQDPAANLLDEVAIQFLLYGEPTPQSVGFDYAQSSWKVEYKLYLTDSMTLEKIGRCHRTEDYKLACPLNPPTGINKKIQKDSILIAKGRFKKKQLLVESNRDVSVPVELSPQVVKIFNEARTSDNNPTFVLFVRSRAFTKVVLPADFGNRFSNRVRFKTDYSASIVRPLKYYNEDKTFQNFWNISNFGVSFTINRAEDSSIRGFGVFNW